MKKLCTLLLLAMTITACQVSPAAESVEMMTDQQIADFDWNDFTIFEENLIPEVYSVLDTLTTAPYYLLNFELDETLETVKGTVVVRYTNNSQDTLESLLFQLFPAVYGGWVDLGEITVNEQTVDVEANRSSVVVTIPLTETLMPGSSCVVRIPFESSIPRDMGGNYGLYGYFDEVVVLDGFYPLLALYDEGKWHMNITSFNGDIKFEEMSFYQVTGEMPSDLVAITTGQEIATQKSGDMKTVQYIAGPVREFYLAASEQFVTQEQQVGETNLLSTGMQGSEDAIAHAMEIGEASFQIYTDRFGVYPYSEMDVISTPMQALGMEYPGVATVTTRLYDLNGDMNGTPNRVYLDSVIAHEVGHQWFFNLVGNDQIEEPWLDEAITQYIVGLFYEDYYGPTAAQSYKESWAERWSRVDFSEIPIGKPSYAYDPSEYSPIVYGRGPYFIEALEAEMGSEIFGEALHHYVDDFGWQIATGDDFKAHMEAACECDLTNLFNEWVTP
ncbi:MAG: M1 family metallopeptidase [Anaerolineaceae bacterium]|nr:M1 family metallopeptidase [Anaerolineaceae bacterium]